MTLNFLFHLSLFRHFKKETRFEEVVHNRPFLISAIIIIIIIALKSKKMVVN